MIVTFIYRHYDMSTIYYGKYIGETISDDYYQLNLVDYLKDILSPYFSIQFDDYNIDDKITVGIMGIVPSTSEESIECFSDQEKHIFDLLYIRENITQMPDVYLQGKLVKEIIEE